MNASDRYIVLTGGVGGAKLALGLSRILPDDRLTAIVNTGDDFEHLGLPISPDLDTLMYTLAGTVDEETGWGRGHETWNFMAALDELGGETWFRIGDRDLATHVCRAQFLDDGLRLSEVTEKLCRRFGIRQRIVPMSDDPVRTQIVTDEGPLDFQHYFVRDRAEPRVRRIEYHGADEAQPGPEALFALQDPKLAGIFIAPSNPYLSVDPILAVAGLRGAILGAGVPVIAVSPIVGDQAIKGPTAKIMRELRLEVSAQSVADHYGDLLDGFIVDATDRDAAAVIERERLAVTSCQTIMRTLDDRIRLAKAAMAFARDLAKRD
jgi:LPPG:FO 2-phospho-L-lactate transferase